jgi:hypothetical protein
MVWAFISFLSHPRRTVFTLAVFRQFAASGKVSLASGTHVGLLNSLEYKPLREISVLPVLALMRLFNAAQSLH